jgi:hypothetical protein
MADRDDGGLLYGRSSHGYQIAIRNNREQNGRIGPPFWLAGYAQIIIENHRMDKKIKKMHDKLIESKNTV